MGEDEKILLKISLLEDEHRSLDALVSQKSTIDQLHVMRLKKRKLRLKDEIARLHALIEPDIIA